ncbi:MAG: hypothetical protein OEW00_14315 [candidate division Zixibacteria bacterium]|nr:hypothetical protein [candidate division Zixibacteria bacterium]
MIPREEKSSADSLPPIESEETLLSWTTHPMLKRPLITVLVTIFILVISMLVYLAMESKAFSVLALVVLFASLARFYLPTRYRLTDRSITIKSLTQTVNKPWSMYRSCYPDKNGILLSPFAEPSRLENFRGIYLLFGNNKEEVTSTVKDRIREHQERATDRLPAGGDDREGNTP